MLFDFETFQTLVARSYEPGPYSLGDVLSVFRYYFQCYEEKFGRPHPNIRTQQIRRIVTKMPYITAEMERELSGSGFPEIPATVYPYIIDKHFETEYLQCDFNINHFFSGKIRFLRCQEAERCGG